MWIMSKSDVDPFTDEEDEGDYKDRANRIKIRRAKEIEEEKMLMDLATNIVKFLIKHIYIFPWYDSNL